MPPSLGAPAEPASLGLEAELAYAFRNPALLQLALTHRSASTEHNERLEFLGDAVLNAAVSAMLFDRLGDSSEGDLTRVRAQMVREESLHRVALALGLPLHLRVSEGEARSGGRERASMLADAVEAIIAAVYLDGGFESAQALVARLMGAAVEQASQHSVQKDAKTALQEWLQAKRRSVPVYRIVATQGQAHAQTFEVTCEVHEGRSPASASQHTLGRGSSRRAAEQAAAEAMLARLLGST